MDSDTDFDVDDVEMAASSHVIEWWEREIWWERGEEGKEKEGELGGNQAEVDSREVVKLTTAANTTQTHFFLDFARISTEVRSSLSWCLL